MEAGRFSPNSRCPSCDAEVADDANYCTACGSALDTLDTLGPHPTPARLAVARIVDAESSAEVVVEHAQTPGALARLPALAALAWRQPVVRSVVTTGASAVALSLVWRVAGAAFSGRRAGRALLAESDGLSPLVGDLLSGAKLSKRLTRRGRRGMIIEEMVYIRRVLRK